MRTTNEAPAVLTDTAGAHEKQKQRSQNISQNGQAGKTVAENAVTPRVPPEPPQPLPWASSFKLGHDGVYKTEMRENEAPVDTWICSPLIVEARTRDIHGQNWGLLLAVQAPDTAWHRWAMPMQLTGGNGNAYREILLSLALCLADGAQKHLHTYLVTAKPARLIRCVPTIGWHNGVYVLPDASYGHSAEEMTLQTASPDTLFRTRGTLEDWQKHVGQYCSGNSRLMFATCAGIARLCCICAGWRAAAFTSWGVPASESPYSSWLPAALPVVAGKAAFCGVGGPRTTRLSPWPWRIIMTP